MATKETKPTPPVEKANVKTEQKLVPVENPTPTAKATPPAPTTSAAPAAAPAPLKSAILAEMPSYQSNKRVWALKIEKVVLATIDSPAQLEFSDSRFAPIEISKGYLDEWHPHAGGYYVLEGNGHQSFLSEGYFEYEYKEAK